MELLAAAPWVKVLAAVSAATLTACGYHAVYSGVAPEERLSVTAASHQVADLMAVHVTLAAARTELSRASALRSDSGYPRLVVEILRVDETASGIVAGEGPWGAEQPRARGASVAVSARGLVVASTNGEVLVDTGDVRRVAHFASSVDPQRDGAARDSAVRAAARATGRAVARRALGLPEPSREPL